MTWETTHRKAKRIAKIYKKCVLLLVDVLIEVERDSVLEHTGRSSLYEYGVTELELSHHESLNFVGVSRVCRKFPLVNAALHEGFISMTHVKMLSPILNAHNESHWVELAKGLSTRQLKRAIALALIRKIELRCEITLEEEEALYRALEITGGTIGQTVGKALTYFVEHQDPVKKAERAVKRTSKKLLVSKRVYKNSVRTKLPSLLQHQAMLESQGTCTHPGCDSRRYLQVHHCEPVSVGGKHELSNLRVLCSLHHKLQHK